MIAVVNYGRGNLASVANALNRLRAPFRIVREAEELTRARAVLLPGVGAFDDAVLQLRTDGLMEPLRRLILEGKPLLGICLGLQLLFESSEEGRLPGLGVFPGTIRDFRRAPGRRGEKIPHVGWSPLAHCTDPLLCEGQQFYFVHSYYLDTPDKDLISSTCHQILDFPASIRRGGIRAFQFHPEKSGELGLQLLKAAVQDMLM